MRTNVITRTVAAALIIGALCGCFSSSKEVVHDKPVYVNPPPSTTVVVPEQTPAK